MNAQLRYLAFISNDPDTLSDFYTRHFGLEKLGRSEHGDVSLSDGFYNLTFLKSRPNLGEPRMEIGLHHLGLQVDDVSETTKQFFN
jgi:catechol 2,3-dioxygenase-like lactoylglutathione lyase family enzyme